jgi:hypothetical protein
MWTTKESEARKLGIVMHAAFQNPERLEMMSQYFRKLRGTPQLWPAWAHIAASVGSMFTHNQYPAHQKLFLEVWELRFGFFQELSIACFYCPQYFELGLYISRKLLVDPEFEKQAKPVQDMTRRNRELFEARLKEWTSKGIKMTAPIRKHLIERAHRLYAQARFARAKDLYALALHPIVMPDAIADDSLLPKSSDGKSNDARKEVEGEGELVNTVVFHKAWRLSAWAYGRPLHHAVTESDQERALCCYQMGRCAERLPQGSGPTGKLLVAAHYLDALKFAPLYAPAISAMYELTHLAPSDVTRCILYMMRSVSAGGSQQAAMLALRPIKTVMEAMSTDQSVCCRVTPQPKLCATIIMPVAHPAPAQPCRATHSALPHTLPLLAPSLHVLTA